MKLNFKNVFVGLFVLALSLVFTSDANAAADIAILSATVTSANTVLVSLVNPGASLATVTAANWHIDVGGGGSTPLTPSSAVVTSATAPWTVTLTFAGTPFSSTATSYLAAVGLYADALAVSDGTDTNAVVLHSASVAILDGQVPTFTAARTALNTTVLTFSEAVDASDTATAAWTVAGGTVTAVTDPANSTALTITTTGLTSTSSTPAVNYVAGSGTVVDAATNEVGNGGAVAAADQVKPTFTASRTALNTIVLTFSETVDASDTATAAWTVAGATVAAATDPASSTTLTLTTTGLTSPTSTPLVTYVAASGTVKDIAGALNEVLDGLAVSAADAVRPTLAVTLSDYDLGPNQTATVTFTFSEAPTGFSSADVTVGGGTLGTIDTTNPLVQTAKFTPTAHTHEADNTVSVGTGWTDGATNAPAGTSTSATYEVDTRTSGGGGGSGGGGSSHHTTPVTPAVPANTQAPADCTAGVQFSPSTGRNCNAATPASPALAASAHFGAYNFGTATLKNGSKGDAVMELQKFLNAKLNLGLVVDGMLGPKTINVIKKWQSDNMLVADGLIGPMTKAKMNASVQ